MNQGLYKTPTSAKEEKKRKIERETVGKYKKEGIQKQKEKKKS